MPNFTGELLTNPSPIDWPGGDNKGNIIGNPEGENPNSHAKGGTADPLTFTPLTDPPITQTDFSLQSGYWMPSYFPADLWTLTYNVDGSVTCSCPGPYISPGAGQNTTNSIIGVTARFRLYPDVNGRIQYVARFKNVSWGSFMSAFGNDQAALGAWVFPEHTNAADSPAAVGGWAVQGFLWYGIVSPPPQEWRMGIAQHAPSGGAWMNTQGSMQNERNQTPALIGQRFSPQADVCVRVIHRWYRDGKVGGIGCWRLDVPNLQWSFDGGASYQGWGWDVDYQNVSSGCMRFGIIPQLGLGCRGRQPPITFTIHSFVIEQGIVIKGSGF